MTRDEILSLEAGRELDFLIAEKVLGWRWFKIVSTAVLIPPWRLDFMRAHPVLYEEIGGSGDLKREFLDGRWFGGGETTKFQDVPHYSTDWSGVGQIVEALNRVGWLVTIKQIPDGYPFRGPEDMEPRPLIFRRAVCELTWMLMETPEGIHKSIFHNPLALADATPLAVCRAALLASLPDAEGV